VKNAIKSGDQPNHGFAVSVFLSHMSLYSNIWENHKFDSPEDHILILEDDAQLNENWEVELVEAMQGVPADFDIVRLGIWGNVRDADKISPHVYASKQPFWIPPRTAFYGGAHAVLMKAGRIPRVMSKLKKIPMGDIDNMMTTCCEDLLSYAIYPSLVRVKDELQESSENPFHETKVQGVSPSAQVLQLHTNDMNIEPAPKQSLQSKVLDSVRDGLLNQPSIKPAVAGAPPPAVAQDTPPIREELITPQGKVNRPAPVELPTPILPASPQEPTVDTMNRPTSGPMSALFPAEEEGTAEMDIFHHTNGVLSAAGMSSDMKAVNPLAKTTLEMESNFGH